MRLDFHHVEQLLNLAGQEKGGEVELPNGWRAKRVGRRTDSRIILQAENPAEDQTGYEFDLSIPSEVQIPAISTQVRVTFVRYAEVKGRYNPASLLDASLLGTPLVLRNWRPGDRLHPLHRGSEEKLKRLFQEKHVPAEQRSLWPILTNRDKVVWAKGFAVAAEFAAREGTSQAVLVEALEQ